MNTTMSPPYASGGPPTVDNIQLRCRAHNGYEAELDFGPRDPSIVREPRAPYLITDLVAVASTRLRNPAATRSGPSSGLSHTQPLAQIWIHAYGMTRSIDAVRTSPV